MPINAGTVFVNVLPNTAAMTGVGAKGLLTSFKGMGAMAGVAFAGAAAVGIGKFLADSVAVASEFDTTMRTISAVTEVSGKSLDRFKDLAIDMGQRTVFSANEAGEAILELSKAGVKTADILGGGLKNTLDLATAGDLELAEAATIASNAMNVFGLSGTESQQAADALAGAANASSADVRDLAQALAQGGNAAASAGLSIQETTGVLAAFADAGIKGSDAGTSLKTFMLSLVPTTDKAKQAMRELNMTFVDQKGNIKSLTAIADELKGGLKGLTQAEQQVALKTIFGTDAFRAANIVQKEGAKGLAKYVKETTKVGNAQRVGAKRMSGFKGAMESLRGSIETIQLAIGEAMLPTLKNLAKQLTRASNSKDFQRALEALTSTIKVLGPVVMWIGNLVIGNFVRTFVAAGKAILVARNVITGAVNGIRQVVSAVVTAVGGDLSELVAVFQNAADTISGIVNDILSNAGALSGVLPGAGLLDPGSRASGGSVSGGSPYLVGERGPELFVPSNSGRIIANSQVPVGGGLHGATLRIVDSNTGQIMVGVVEQHDRYKEGRARAHR